MESEAAHVPASATPPRRRAVVRDDLAYMLPMGAFLALIYVGTLGPETPAGNAAYPWAYTARALLVAGLLYVCWPAYTRIRWTYWWLGLIVGVVGIVQWVGMQLWLQNTFELFKPKGVSFEPDAFFKDPTLRWAFIAVRIFGAVLVVPVMEELFWRDFCWRSVIAPNDFKLAHVGEWDLKAFLIVPLLFCTVHLNWLIPAIVWALMIGALLAYTKSLGACIIAHAVTNLLLALYVLHTKQWFFW